MADRAVVVKARCLKVPKARAESTRRALLASGLLRVDLEPVRDGDFVYLPVNEGELEGGLEVCEHNFKRRRVAPENYRMLVDVPPPLRAMLPRAFDVIGRVIIIKVPDELMGYRQQIGRALLGARPEALSVALDHGVKGPDRVRELEVIAGPSQLETVHVEHGLRFRLDPSKVYFSPRLATERLRVAMLVRNGEAVLDMFAGVGPFTIHIAKRARPSVVYASDINPAAIGYLKQNIALNKASGVEPVLGDAAGLPGLVPPVDRIIMNLPHSAFGFLPAALRLLRPGGTIHLYEILGPGEKASRMQKIERVFEDDGRKLARSGCHLVRGYSALESHFVFDLTVA